MDYRNSDKKPYKKRKKNTYRKKYYRNNNQKNPNGAAVNNKKEYGTNVKGQNLAENRETVTDMESADLGTSVPNRNEMEPNKAGRRAELTGQVASPENTGDNRTSVPNRNKPEANKTGRRADMPKQAHPEFKAGVPEQNRPVHEADSQGKRSSNRMETDQRQSGIDQSAGYPDEKKSYSEGSFSESEEDFEEEFSDEYEDDFTDESGRNEDYRDYDDDLYDENAQDFAEADEEYEESADRYAKEQAEDFEEDEDYEDYEEDYQSDGKKKSVGEIIFRTVAGVLITAICITGVMAALLATGHLNSLIVLLEEKTENAAVESLPAPTPTVRVTLTPTPAPTETATPAPTDPPTPTVSPTEAADDVKSDSKADKSAATTPGTDSSAAVPAGVMTFHEVNDVVTAKETTNLRNVPSQGEESFIVNILQNGETVKRTGMSDEGWSKLEYDGQEVYAMSNLLTTDLSPKESAGKGSNGTDDSAASNGSLPEIKTVFTDVNEQVTPKIEVNLRLLPSVTNPAAKVIATIRNGEVVTRTGVNEELGWSRVEYNGQTLYCISSYVEPVAPQA